MNANELADYLDNNVEAMLMSEQQHIDQAATMLRQQQEQIDKLTAIVALRELKIERMIEDRSKYEAMAHAGGVEVGKELKTLTDEEIKEVWMHRPVNTAEGVIDFARAILRKAQEK
jgi:hypothetical protein